ncbi:hypothetical protein [Anabaena sp. 4-3]|uniref:hypothetical protein n=1 Tax=Anabaena sp. 4-3 TaxID=1811979 RepID=UPI00082A0A44|nr:hypothetical protein [Anabaena sp. 4-3]
MPRQTKLSLVPGASMPGVEPSGFYQTPNHMAMKAIRAKLTSADWCVWSYLQMIDPFGDRFVDIPNPREIAEIVGLSEKSVKRSIHKLEELGFYDTQIITIKGKNLAGKAIRDDKKLDKVVPKRTKLSTKRQSCPKTDKVVHKKTKLSQNGQSCPNESLKPLPDKASEFPHTIHTYSDFINTLSDSEREDFLKFGEQKALQLPHPPQLPRRWVETNWEELSSQWRKSKGQASLAQNSKWENHPQREEWLEKIRQLGPVGFQAEDMTNQKLRREFYLWADANKLIWGIES